MPKLRQLKDEIANKDFDIVGINIDDTLYMSNAEQMVMRQGYNWRNVRSANSNAVGFATLAARTLGVNALPFMFLVDRAGNVRAIHTRSSTSGNMIRELLQN